MICSAKKPNIKPSAMRRSCQRCAKTFSGGQLVQDAPVFNDQTQGHDVLMRLYCDHCNHIQTWREAAFADGTLQGVAIDEAAFIRGKRTIEKFLRKYPYVLDLQPA